MRGLSDELLGWLDQHDIGRGSMLALACFEGVGLGLACYTDVDLTNVSCHAVADDSPLDVVAALDQMIGPRWVLWDRVTADSLVTASVPVDRCWDVVTVARLLRGRWESSIGLAWAWLNDLALDSLPQMGQLDLLSAAVEEGDRSEPVRPDGHIRPEWLTGGWHESPVRLASWAGLSMTAAGIEQVRIQDRPNPIRARSTAHSESAADLLCAEMESAGLPLDEHEAVRIISDAVGPRAETFAMEDELRRTRDAEVTRHLEYGRGVNLRNPAEVKAMLLQINVDLPDTRAWRLEQICDQHPLIPALLTWRKAERIATTYGYRWMDEHVRAGRLHGQWSSSDGAAGRMTASAGLHNLPTEMRTAVRSDDGYVFVRADLGQIEPRVLAAVSSDRSLIAATQSNDLYQPIADELGVDRDIAKVAVLGAMYGSTTGESAQALKGLQKSYRAAMAHLEAAADAGTRGDDVMTVGGRRIRMWFDDSAVNDADKMRRLAAARGRFARNAIIQGAAAEFFKVWAVIVRARSRSLGAQVVLCLHDELLVHTPENNAAEVATLVADSVDRAAYHWSPTPDVRFLAEVSIIRRWSEAKP